VVAQAGHETIDVAPYQDKRDLFCDGLQSIGYNAPKPAGAFYIFPQTPIPDDLAFIRLLLNEGILAVPGAGFGRPGYIRLTLTVPRDTIARSLPAFARAFAAARAIA
jgi:aspartate aminotransferase